MRSQRQPTFLDDGSPNELEKLQEFLRAIFGSGRIRFDIESEIHRSGSTLSLNVEVPLSEVLDRMRYFEAAVAALQERERGASAAEIIRRHQAAEILEAASAFDEAKQEGSE